MGLSDSQLKQNITENGDNISGCRVKETDDSKNFPIEVNVREPFIGADQLYQVLPTTVQDSINCTDFNIDDAGDFSVTFDRTYYGTELEDFEQSDVPIINRFLEESSDEKLQSLSHSWDDGHLIIYSDWGTLSHLQKTLTSSSGIPFAPVSVFLAPTTSDYRWAMRLRKFLSSTPMEKSRVQELNKRTEEFGTDCPNCSSRDIYLNSRYLPSFSCSNCHSSFPQLTPIEAELDGTEEFEKLNTAFNDVFQNSIQNADDWFFDDIKLQNKIYDNNIIIYTINEKESNFSSEGNIALVIPDDYEDIVITYDIDSRQIQNEEDVDQDTECDNCGNDEKCRLFGGGTKNSWGILNKSHFLCDDCISKLNKSVEKALQNENVMRRLVSYYL